MTKSDTYIGTAQEIINAENLAKTVPEIKAKFSMPTKHNGGATTSTLTTTEKTLDVSHWTEGADFLMAVYTIPRSRKAYSDDGVVTVSATHYNSGKVTIAGYTTAVTNGKLEIVITFSAGKFAGLEKITAYPHPHGTYYISIVFTDLAGVIHYVIQYVKPTDKNLVIDLKAFSIDRASALTITMCPWNTEDTKGPENNVTLVSPYFFVQLYQPIMLQFGSFNSLDVDSPAQGLSTTGSYTLVRSYIERFQAFINDHPKPYGIPISVWIDTLAKGAAYAIDKGWVDATKYNNMSEVLGFSKSLVGAYSKILTGEYETDVSVPSHFSSLIEGFLESPNFLELLLVAAIWAICDDIALEVSL